MPRLASPPRRRRYRIFGFFLLAAPTLAACAMRAQPSTTPSTRPASTAIADAEPTPGAPRLSLPEVRGMSTRAFTSVSPDHQWRAEAQLASFPGEVPYEYERVTITRTDLFDSWVAHERPQGPAYLAVRGTGEVAIGSGDDPKPLVLHDMQDGRPYRLQVWNGQVQLMPA